MTSTRTETAGAGGGAASTDRGLVENGSTDTPGPAAASPSTTGSAANTHSAAADAGAPGRTVRPFAPADRAIALQLIGQGFMESVAHANNAGT